MRNNGLRSQVGLTLALVLLAVSLCGGSEQTVTEQTVGGLQVVQGAINGVRLARNGKSMAVYGDPRENPLPVDVVLLTHHRRDVVWAGRELIARGAKAVVPAGELALFTDVNQFWSQFQEERFHDYAHKSTKVLSEPLPIWKPVKGGDTWNWEGVPIHVLDTPGYTRGSVSYLIELEGQRLALTGDLISGDGKILDLYSFQDAVPELGIMAYHGYAARLADLIASLRKIAAQQPTLLVPARGPIVHDPQKAIETLIARIERLYANYLLIDAHRYYLPEDRFIAKGRRVLGPDAEIRWLPSAETIEPLPNWIVPIDNARLIVSEDKTGFLVDCGSQRIIDELKKLQAEGKLSSIEHIFVTHYHDDHTDHVDQCVQTFGSTVHASRRNWDILENPAAYRMPCLTKNPIHVSGRAESGAKWRWKEFEMTLLFFPGQTLQHDALLVTKDSGEQYLFAGDSFTPSGIDDYCLLNRNLLHEGMGYFYCLQNVQQNAPEALLINQHVVPAFRFSTAQIDQMLDTLHSRVEIMRELLAWDDPNFGIDEGWARFYPYAVRARPGETVEVALRIMNHSPAEQVFRVTPHLPANWTLSFPGSISVRIPALEEGAVRVRATLPAGIPAGTYLMTADLQFNGWDLHEWTEAMVTVPE